MDSEHDEPKVFDSEDMFKNHISLDHKDELSKEDLETIAHECYQRIDHAYIYSSKECPFACKDDCTDMKDEQFTDHVMKHLLFLSQISLWGYEPAGPVDSAHDGNFASDFEASNLENDSISSTIKLFFEEDGPVQWMEVNWEGMYRNRSVDDSDDYIASEDLALEADRMTKSDMPADNARYWYSTCKYLRDIRDAEPGGPDSVLEDFARKWLEASANSLLAAEPVPRTPEDRTEEDTWQHLKDEWMFSPDLDLAPEIIQILALTQAVPLQVKPKLCSPCTQLVERIFETPSSSTYSRDHLRQNSNANTCDLCELLWKTSLRTHQSLEGYVTFHRQGPFLTIQGEKNPSLSIVVNPLSTSIPEGAAQLGLATLPEAGSDMHLSIIRHWVESCDKSHTCRATNEFELPTRVLDVGMDGDDQVRLRSTEPGERGHWITLTHPWGFQPSLWSTTANIDSLRAGIDVKMMPKTFLDAVAITRALNHRYLWIDALCIVQSDTDDWQNEAKRMEQYYGNAYCNISAVCATDSGAGFLRPRAHRDRLTLSFDEGSHFDICEVVDDFQNHVLGSALHKRAWTLQEHALAHRTIFFTKHQTYFECGEGIRCETLTRLTKYAAILLLPYCKLISISSHRASLLGDPAFPKILSHASRGEMMLRCMDLYSTYSRLITSYPADRAVAIDGLQNRLLRTMNDRGGYGILQRSLCRSLLWCRGSDTPTLKWIDSHNGLVSRVPSWSWMAYTGGIDYLQAPFAEYDWEEIQSPWSDRNDAISAPESHPTLVANVYRFDLTAALKTKEAKADVILDDPAQTPTDSACVILGRGRDKGFGQVREVDFYVLIVSPSKRFTGLQQSGAYERIGVARLQDNKHVETDGVMGVIY